MEFPQPSSSTIDAQYSKLWTTTQGELYSAVKQLDEKIADLRTAIPQRNGKCVEKVDTAKLELLHHVRKKLVKLLDKGNSTKDNKLQSWVKEVVETLHKSGEIGVVKASFELHSKNIDKAFEGIQKDVKA